MMPSQTKEQIKYRVEVETPDLPDIRRGYRDGRLFRDTCGASRLAVRLKVRFPHWRVYIVRYAVSPTGGLCDPVVIVEETY